MTTQAKLWQKAGFALLLVELILRMSNLLHGVAMEASIAIATTGTLGALGYSIYLRRQAKRTKLGSASTHRG